MCVCVCVCVHVQGEPAFSFAAPHDLHAMNRSAPGFHHIGDISLRVRSNDSSAAYKDISTVTRHGSAGTARCGSVALMHRHTHARIHAGAGTDNAWHNNTVQQGLKRIGH